MFIHVNVCVLDFFVFVFEYRIPPYNATQDVLVYIAYACTVLFLVGNCIFGLIYLNVFVNTYSVISL